MSHPHPLLLVAEALVALAEVARQQAALQPGTAERMTVKQAAVFLGCGASKVREMASRKVLPALKVGRGYTFDARDIEAFRRRSS